MTRTGEHGGFSIHLVQLAVEPGLVERNCRRIEALLETAPLSTGDLVLLPEMFPCGFFYRDLGAMADRAPEVFSWMADLAGRKGVLLAGSMPARRGDGIVNRLRVAGPDRGSLGVYDKVHLFSFAREDRHFAAGGSPCVVDLGGVMAGLLICFDLRFPEMARSLCLRGATLLLAPSQWPLARAEHFRLFARVRAMENQVFLAAANACGPDAAGTEMGGGSILAGPMGEVLAEAGQGEEVVSGFFSMEEIRRVRGEFPVLSARRPDAYAGPDG